MKLAHLEFWQTASQKHPSEKKAKWLGLEQRWERCGVLDAVSRVAHDLPFPLAAVTRADGSCRPATFERSSIPPAILGSCRTWTPDHMLQKAIYLYWDFREDEDAITFMAGQNGSDQIVDCYYIFKCIFTLSSTHLPEVSLPLSLPLGLESCICSNS